MIDRIEQIAADARAAIAQATTTGALEQARVQWLGRKAELPNLLRGVAELEPAERGRVGKAANLARRELEEAIAARHAELEAAELERRLVADRVDVTLPGDPPQPVGRLHLITQTWRELEDVFLGLGFTVVEGPEVETVHYNFDALNHSPTHPAREPTDT
ncbi:MAG TPA: phenylalanine--tRNA ligase subunit alpha, partial [Solirubrobacteraceae bacterium]